jgi:hypothetical protein
MRGSHEMDLGRGFHGRPPRFAILINAVAAGFAAAALSLCLVVALTALSIRVMAAPIAG